MPCTGIRHAYLNRSPGVSLFMASGTGEVRKEGRDRPSEFGIQALSVTRRDKVTEASKHKERWNADTDYRA